jgi:hypothetical protein
VRRLLYKLGLIIIGAGLIATCAKPAPQPAPPRAGTPSTVAASPTPNPVHLTAKEKQEYGLLAAFFAAGNKVEKAGNNAIDQLAKHPTKAISLAKAGNLYLDAITAVDKDGFLSGNVRAGGALKQLEGRFMIYADALDSMMHAHGAFQFMDRMTDVDRAKGPLRAELHRIAGTR